MADDRHIGTEFAGFRIEGSLTRDGMGVVYCATDSRFDRRVALRLLNSEFSKVENFRTCFLRESKLAASLDHPNIIPVYRAGEAEGQLFVASRLVEGVDLASLLVAEGHLEPQRALSIVTQLAAALDAARWSQGLVHGGLKPGDVLIVSRTSTASGERALLGGFGLRQAVVPRTSDAVVSQSLGTLDYIAPEQTDGKSPSPRSDIYALGCILFECLTGKPPFRKESPGALLQAHLHEQPPSVRRERPDLPNELDWVIRRAMAKWPEERYPSCGELAASAETALMPGAVRSDPRAERSALPVLSPRAEATTPEELPTLTAIGEASVSLDSPALRTWTTRRKPLSAIGLALLFVALAAGAIWLTGGESDAGSSATPAPPVAEIPREVGTTGVEGTTDLPIADEVSAEPAPVSEVPGESSVDGSAEPVVSGPGSMVRIDARTGEILARVPIPFPKLVASSGPSVWVLSDPPFGARNEVLFRVAVTTNAVTHTFDAAGLARGLAAANGSAWLGDDQGFSYRFTPGTARELVTFASPDGRSLALVPGSQVGVGRSLWVSAFPPGPCCVPPPDLYRVNPVTGSMITRIDGAGQVVAAGPGFLWALGDHDWGRNRPDGPLLRIDMETHTAIPIDGLELKFPWADFTVGQGAVWTSVPSDRAILRLDPLTGEESERIRIGRAPWALAAGAGAVWAAIRQDGTVVRYDIATDRIEAIDVGGRPKDLVFAGDSVWVAVEEPLATPESASLPFILDLQTGERTPLPEELAGGQNYVGSPDGRRLAYGTCCDAADVMTIAKIDGTELQALESSEGLNIYGARWSPDGTKLVYQERDGAVPDSVGNLFVQDLYGRTQLTDLELSRAHWWFLSPSFSPDRRHVMFHLPRDSRRRTNWDVWSVPVTGGKPTLVLRDASFPMDRTGGPEGMQIAFIEPGPNSFAGQRIMLGRETPDADLRHTLVEAVDAIRWPTMSPDGDRIAYQDGGSIYVVEVWNGEPSRVAEGSTAEWLNNDTLIVVP